MNRMTARTLATLAGLALPAAALANTVTVNFPLSVADVPTAGVNTNVSLTVVETDATNNLTAGDVARVFVTVVSVDAAGAETILVQDIEVTAGAGGTTLGAGANATTNLVVDLSGFASNLTLAANAAPANSVGIGLIFTVDDQAGAASTGIVQTGDFDTNGEPVAATDGSVFDNDPVTATGAFLDAANDNLFLVYSRSLNAGDAGAAPGGNDGNQTTTAEINAVAAADVLIDADGDFSAGAANVNGGAFAANTAFLAGSNGTVVEITYNNANTNVTIGSFVRIGDGGNGDPVTDILGNRVNNNNTPAANERGDEDGVQITALADLTITGAVAEAIVTGDAAVANAIRVQYNLPLNPADLGNAVFYSDFLQNTLGDSDLQITAIAADPNDNAAVLLTIDRVDADPDENLWPDGLDDDGNAFSILTDVTNAARNEPGSVFDGADAGVGADDDYQAAAQTVTITDGIAPSIDGFAFLDTDGDGELDGVAVFGNEPITTSTLTLGDFNIDVQASQTLRPLALLDSEGDFPAGADLPVSQAFAIAPTAATAGNVSVATAGAPARLGVGNAVILAFDPSAANWSGAGAGTNAPGTDGPAGLFALDHPAFTITDGSTNTTDVAVGTDVAVNTDRAAPVVANTFFLTGDNIADANNATFEATLSQNIAETDGTVADQQTNDRLAFVFGENVALNSGSATFLDDLTIDGQVWNDDLGGTAGAARAAVTSANKLFVENIRDGGDGDFTDGDEVVAVAAYGPGSVAAFTTSGDVTDGSGNAAESSEAAVDRTAPYVRLLTNRVTPANPLDSAFLIDDNGDNLADRVLVSFTEAVLAADLNAADFEVTDPATGVSISAVATANGGASDSSIFLTIAGTVSMDSSIEITYEGTDADDNSRLLQGATSGNEVSPVDTTFDAERVQEPTVEGQEIAIQTITGSGLSADGSAFDVGTRIVAFLGTPVVERISTTHNNIPFVYDFSEGNYGAVATTSFESFTDWFFGIEEFVYLTRQNGNVQTFVNEKDDAQESSSDGSDFEFNTDILNININASNLDRITFSSTAEVSSNRASGEIELRWDLFRSNGGTIRSLFESGFDVGGEPVIAGETVVTQTDGTFVLHVTGPSSRFWSASRLSEVPLPIILIVEETDGTRTIVTSMLDGVSGPLLFNPQNTRQNSDGTAPANTIYNINLANTGNNFLYDGWNILAFDRVGGYAAASNDIPLLPSGIAAGDITTDSPLPIVDAFDQFVYWEDDNNDGVWTSDDDGANEFDSFMIDHDLLDSFAFTLDDSGVRTDGSAFIAGYAAGFYLGDFGTYGVAQFGAELNQTSIFPTATPFPNDNSTFGWGLFTVTDGRGTEINETTLFANNANLDLVIQFHNFGTGIDIQNSAAEDFESMSPFTIFGHFIDP